MLDNYVCNDRIRNDEVANILLSLNRKIISENLCNDKEDNNGEGENKQDTNDQFDANVNMSAHELGKGNISLAEECGLSVLGAYGARYLSVSCRPYSSMGSDRIKSD
jgi:hypothetical protein